MSRTILAIDPGTFQSGYAFVMQYEDIFSVIESGVAPNDEIRKLIQANAFDDLAIEMISSYGMAVGNETFETCVWIGRFAENYIGIPKMVFRATVKLHLCKSTQAKDGNIRQALIDRFGGDSVALAGKKCKKCKDGITKTVKPKPCTNCNGSGGWEILPGPLYNVSSHAWAALAVAITALEV